MTDLDRIVSRRTSAAVHEKSKRQRKKKRTCKVCGREEKLFFGGLYSNLTPYSQICADCINKAIKRT